MPAYRCAGVPPPNLTYKLAVSITNLKGLRRPAWTLATALLICGFAFIVARWFDWKPLILPVDLRPGVTRSPEFRVSREVRYVVTLEVDHNISTDKLYCLLGGVPWRPPCAGDSVVDIQWTLWSGSQEIASGDSRNAGGASPGSTVTRTFGQFEGSPGTAYVLEVVSMLDGSALAATNPRIVVQVHPDVTKDYHVVFLLVAPFVLPIVLFGVMLLTIWAVGACVRWTKA